VGAIISVGRTDENSIISASRTDTNSVISAPIEMITRWRYSAKVNSFKKSGGDVGFGLS